MKRKSPYKQRFSSLCVLDYARSSWQRIGHLKILCSLASPSYGTNLQGITSRFQTKVSKLQTIPQSYYPQVLKYIQQHRSIQYKIKDKPLEPVEWQDFHLSDPSLPAQSGALTGRLRGVNYLKTEYVEIPTWAVKLRLLRKGNYTLTDRGKVLLALGRNTISHRSQSEIEVNPFALTNGEKYFFLYCILEADGDLLKNLYYRLALHEGDITKAVVGQDLVDSFKELASTFRLGRASIHTSATARQLLDMAETLSNQSDQMIIPRTEPLVDCGLLTRINPYRLEYRITQPSRAFIGNMHNYGRIDEFLLNCLAESVVELFSLKCNRLNDLVLGYIAKSYLQLRTGLGYCSIRELALLAIGISLDIGEVYFEIQDVEQSLLDLEAKHKTRIRFTKDRQGNIALVRIDKRLAEELNDTLQI